MSLCFPGFFLRTQRDVLSFFIVGVALVGIWLVLSPGAFKVRWENLWGLSSGVSAAAAMIYLNISRRYHDSQTILFFMFGVGGVLMLLIFGAHVVLGLRKK